MSILKLSPDEDTVPREDEESYVFHWSVPDWNGIMEFEHLVTDQKLVFETRSNLTPSLQTRWLVGLRSVKDEDVEDNTKRFARLYWQLMDIQGTDESELSVIVRTNLLDGQGFSEYNDLKEETVSVGDSIDAKKIHHELEIGSWLSHAYRNVVAIDDSIRYFLELTIKRTPAFVDMDMEKFIKASAQQLSNNFAVLLEDGSNSDVKIVSRDDIEFPAHKLILMAQCPVFAGMFNSELFENADGIVKTTDISGKTMKILLNYFYTGELSEYWRDDDIIVEFTYAAGKYQMNNVLYMLDNQLGKLGKKAKCRHIDVQLLSLVGKLELKNAEKRLFKYVKIRVQRLNKSDELFELFGIEKDELLKTAEKKLGVNTVLKVWDCSVGNAELEAIFNSNALLVLAMVSSTSKKIEKVLLKRLAKSVNEIEEADELFKIMGHE